MPTTGLRSRITAVPLALLALCAVQVPGARAQQPSTAPVIVVGVPDDRPPYAYLGGDGEAAGFTVDVMRAMARVMGFEVGFVPGSRAEVDEALRGGKIDVLAALPRSAQTEAWAELTAPLVVVDVGGRSTGLCLAVRDGNTELRDRLDQGLETLRTNGQFQRLYDEHVGITRMQQPGSTLGGWLLPIVVVFLLLLLAGFALWLRTAPRQGAGGPPAG